MLKSVNTPMQKTNNVTCWVMIMMMMDFLRYKKKAKKFLKPVLGYKNYK